MDTARVIESCNKIWALGKILSQPSEPLEERWSSSWKELQSELAFLYQYLMEFNKR
jgi:hypothetical protein